MFAIVFIICYNESGSQSSWPGKEDTRLLRFFSFIIYIAIHLDQRLLNFLIPSVLCNLSNFAKFAVVDNNVCNVIVMGFVAGSL